MSHQSSSTSQAYCSGTRAVLFNSRNAATQASKQQMPHTASSTSRSSGRERRRAGKTKMQTTIRLQQERITMLQQRTSDLVAQNGCLIELVNELSQRCACQDPAEIFDLFGDDADVATEEVHDFCCYLRSEAAVQTDISVDLHKPDIFLTLPLNTPAHADAAAGLAVTHAKDDSQSLASFSQNLAKSDELLGTEQCTLLASPAEQLRVPMSISRDVAPVAHLEQSSRQALEVANSEHRGSGSKEYKPPPGGPLPEPVQTQPVLFDAIAAESDSSSQPLDTMAVADDFNSHQDLALTPEQSSRQALEVDNAEHRGSGSKEHKLSPGGPLPEPVQTQPVLFDAIAAESDSSTQPLDTMAVADDFNSQNLALSGTPSELLPFQSSQHEDRMYADFMVKLHTHQTCEATTQHCADGTLEKDLDSQELYNTSDEVVMSGFAPSPRLAPDDDNARHRAEGSSVLDSRLAPDVLHSRHRDHGDQSASQALAMERHRRVQDALAFVKRNAPRITEGLLAHTERFATSEFYGSALENGNEIALIALQTSMECYLQDAGCDAG